MVNFIENLIGLNRRYLSKGFIFVADTVISVFASTTVVMILNAMANFRFGTRFIVTYVLCSLLYSVIVFALSKTYRIIIRHLSVKDITRFFLASVAKFVLLAVTIIPIRPHSKTVLIILVIDFFFTFFLLIGIRILMILVYELVTEKSRPQDRKQRVMVYGTSEKSVSVISRLKQSTHYIVVGFLVQSDQRMDFTIDRLKIFSFKDVDDLANILQDHPIDGVLFSKDTDAQKEENRLISYCSSHGIKTLIIPSVEEMAEGQSILKPRPVKVEDLLGRKEIKISMDAIRDYFSGKVVMVTGAAGSIGSELCRQLARFGISKLVLYDNAETPMHYLRLELEDKFPHLDFVPVIGDVRQPERLDFAFRTHHPELVFHAAAYKHVPLMEENPCEAVLVNVYGSRNVADKCIEYNVERMVMISTDKAVNPTNVMGCTKRLAEIYVQSLGLAIEKGEMQGRTKFVTTRFGNVLGSNGSVIPRFREQIEKGGPLTVTDPRITRFFMTIPEACRLVMEAATMSTGNDIFVFDMGEPVKIDTLARRMITLAGYTPDEDIKIVYTGLRPGEKLYEEVLATNENTLPAFHERIRIAKVREYPYADLLKATDNLENLSRAVKIIETVKLMKQIVPEYKSENSRFKELDKR